MLLLNIRQQNAKLGLNIKDPVLNLKTTPPQLDMSTTAPVLEMHQEQGVLEIDQTPCRYSIGLKTMSAFSRDNAEECKQKAQEAIQKIAEEGDRFAQIEKKSNPIAEIAAENMFDDPVDITWAHIDAPIIHYEAKKVEYNAIPGKIENNSHSGTFDSKLDRGTVEGYLLQKASVRMWTTENKYDLYV